MSKYDPHNPKFFDLPAHFLNDDTLANAYYEGLKGLPYEFFSDHDPCTNCIVLAMCKGKNPFQILKCPIMSEYLIKCARIINKRTTLVIDTKIYDYLFWVTKRMENAITVEIVADGLIQIISRTISLNFEVIDYD